MAEELLATLVGLLGAAVLAAATLAGAYLLRRLHEHSDRILELEIAVDRLRLVEEDAFLFGQRRRKARKTARRRKPRVD